MVVVFFFVGDSVRWLRLLWVSVLLNEMVVELDVTKTVLSLR